ncbi:MAG: hypothetical protein GF401_15115, partial [Chitinivibrionales bacterium]|nr:hypothetical protein [Chitinivibrionales bacterium]
MKITIAKKASNDTQVVFLVQEDAGDIVDFKGEKHQLTIRYEKNACIIYCGLGLRENCTTAIIRRGAARAIQKAVELKRTSVSLIPPKKKNCKGKCSEASLEGAVLGAYSFAKYKSEKPVSIKKIELVDDSVAPKGVKQIQALCESVFYARDLVNDNAHVITPAHLAAEAGRLGAASNITTTILDQKELKKKGLGLLYAVGQGSPYPPHLIIMEYAGAAKSKKKTAIVGKGITFDSGGQNLKPSGHIETMRCDMAGAAAAFGLIRALSILKPKINVVAVVPAAHNAIGSTTYFPGDIYKS